MRAMVLGLLALGCVYRVDPPFDGGPGDIGNFCGCSGGSTCCHEGDPATGSVRYWCADLTAVNDCGACGVRCGVGESCNPVDTFGRYECGPPR